MKKKLLIEGMNCNNCVQHVKHALEGIAGVSQIAINLEEKYATVETDVDNSILIDAIDEAGYDVVGIE